MLDHDRAPQRLGQLCSMRVERTLGTVQIRLNGEFDVSCVERFEDQLASAVEPETAVLILDLSGLQFVDSTGLRVLVMLARMTSENGIDYTVLCADEGAVRHVLKETGTYGVLPVISPSGTVPRSTRPSSCAPTPRTYGCTDERADRRPVLASGLRALLQRTDAVVHAAESFQGSAEPLAPDGLSNQESSSRRSRTTGGCASCSTRSDSLQASAGEAQRA